MNNDLTDPRSFFETLEHDLGPKAKPLFLLFRAGETILREHVPKDGVPSVEPVRRMMIVRRGDVAASSRGKLVCTYIAGSRFDALPVLSATDYCYSRPSSYEYVAETDVEILAIDTRVLIDMGKRNTILVLLRNLILFSDMGAKLREKLAEEFERTGLMCFSPNLREDEILRIQGESFEEYYLDFALRVMGELTVGRIVRSDCPSTAITALQRPSWMTAPKTF